MPHSPNGCRELQIMSKYCELCFTTAVKARRRVPSRASEDPTVMLEMMVSTYLERESKAVQGPAKKASRQTKLDPLRMLTVFKGCMTADEVMLRFDYLTLNQRCITLLRVLQKICIEKSPLNYPEEQWGGDRNMNELFNTMIAGEIGLRHLQPTPFSEASLMDEKLTGSSGDAE